MSSIITVEDYQNVKKRLERLKKASPKTDAVLEEMAKLTFLMERWEERHDLIDLE